MSSCHANPARVLCIIYIRSGHWRDVPVERRRQIIGKHAEYLCNRIAPWGTLQERELAGFQFVLADPAALPQRLYEGIDPWKFEHQFIFM